MARGSEHQGAKALRKLRCENSFGSFSGIRVSSINHLRTKRRGFRRESGEQEYFEMRPEKVKKAGRERPRLEPRRNQVFETAQMAHACCTMLNVGGRSM